MLNHDQDLKSMLQSIIDQYLEPITKNLKNVHVRLEQVESRLGKVEDRLDRMEQRMVQIEARVDRVEQRLAQIETRVDRVEQRLAQIETRVDRVEQRLDRMEHHIARIDDRLDRMETVQQQLVQAVIETNEVVNRLELSQQRMESQLNDHTHQIEILHREQLFLKTEFEKMKNR